MVIKPTYAAVFFTGLYAFLSLGLVQLAFALLANEERGRTQSLVAVIILLAVVGVAYRCYRWIASWLAHNKAVRLFNAEYPTAYADWENSWLCHRCGFFGPLN